VRSKIPELIGRGNPRRMCMIGYCTGWSLVTVKLWEALDTSPEVAVDAKAEVLERVEGLLSLLLL
jgi:hypothetical protein